MANEGAVDPTPKVSVGPKAKGDGGGGGGVVRCPSGGGAKAKLVQDVEPRAREKFVYHFKWSIVPIRFSLLHARSLRFQLSTPLGPACCILHESVVSRLTRTCRDVARVLLEERDAGALACRRKSVSGIWIRMCTKVTEATPRL